MTEYRNSAGRLLKVFLALNPDRSEGGKRVDRRQLSIALGVEDDWFKVLPAIADLYREYTTLTNDILLFDESTPKCELYKQNLPDIFNVLASLQVNVAGGHATVNVLKVATFALTYIAADLPQEEAPGEDELQRIRELVAQLQGEIESATELSRTVRDWLLDLVRIIRDSLDRYAIRGSRGLKQQFSMLLGEIMQNWDTIQKVKDKNPGIWQKFTAAIDLMHKVSSLAEKCGPAISFVQKCLPLIKGLVLIAPTDDEVTIDK